MKKIFIALISFVSVIGVFYVQTVKLYPEVFHEDRGSYVKQEVSETTVFSIPEDAGSPLSSAVVPVYACPDRTPVVQVLLVRTQNGAIAYSLNGEILSRTEDNTAGGVYYDGSAYTPLPISSTKNGIIYYKNTEDKEIRNTFAFLRYETLFARLNSQYGYGFAKTCAGSPKFQNYEIKNLGNKVELTKTYNYVWQSDIHFVPFGIFS